PHHDLPGLHVEVGSGVKVVHALPQTASRTFDRGPRLSLRQLFLARAPVHEYARLGLDTLERAMPCAPAAQCNERFIPGEKVDTVQEKCDVIEARIRAGRGPDLKEGIRNEIDIRDGDDIDALRPWGRAQRLVRL